MLHHRLCQLGLLCRGRIDWDSRINDGTVRLDDSEVFHGAHAPLELGDTRDVGTVCLEESGEIWDGLGRLLLGTSSELAQSIVGGEEASKVTRGVVSGLNGEAHDIVSTCSQVLHLASRLLF